MLVTRLETVLEQGSPAEQPRARRARRSRGTAQKQATEPWKQPASPPADELARLVAEIVPHGKADAWLAQVNICLDSAPVALQVLTSHAAHAAQSRAFVQVVMYLQNYLAEADDLTPDHMGRYGLLDDAWLILNTAFRLIESGLLPAQAVPLNWNAIINADPVVRAIIPQEALATLSNIVLQMLQMVVQEVRSYQPWFAPQGHGYNLFMPTLQSGGGTWEDQMNQMLLGTGYSVDDF